MELRATRSLYLRGNQSLTSETRDTVVGRANGWTTKSEVRFLARARYLSLLQNVQKGSETQLSSYLMGTADACLGGKAAGA